MSQESPQAEQCFVVSPETSPDLFLECKIPFLTNDLEAIGKALTSILLFFTEMRCGVASVTVRPSELRLTFYQDHAETVASQYREETKSELSTERIMRHYMAVAYRKAREAQ
jgi:hypothetical protein